MWPCSITIYHFSVTLILSPSLHEWFGYWLFLLSHMIKEFLLNNKMWSQIKMCFRPVKADVSLTGCPVFMLRVLHAFLHIVFLCSPLCGPLCHLPSSAYFPETLFPPAFPASQFFFPPVSKHISQCLAWSLHFSQSPSSVKPVYLADKHFGTSYLFFLMRLTYSFFGIQMSTGRIKWKKAWKVNSPISPPTIGNIFAELQLSGAHWMSCGLWQLLNENISITVRTKLGCFNVMSHWVKSRESQLFILTQEPF